MPFTSAYICSLRLYRIYYVLYKCLHLLAEALPHILCPLQVLTFARWGFTAYFMSFTSAYICSLRLYRIFYVLYKCLHLLAEALPHILCPLQVLTFARWGFTAYIMSFTSAYICSLRLYRIYYVLYKCLHLLAEALPHILCPLQVLTFARWGFTAYIMSFTSAYICSLRLYRIFYVLYKCLHLLAEALPHILCPLQVLTFARWGFTAYIMSFTSAYICSLRLYRIYYVLYKCLHLLAEALPHILCPLQVLTFARWGFTAYIMSFTSAYICSLRLYRIFYVLYKCLHLLAEALPHILCPLQVLTFARWGFTAYIMSFTSAYICSLRLYRIYYVLYKCLHLLAEALPHILCPLQVLTFARWGFTAYIMSFTSAYICSLRLYRIYYVLYKCLHLLAEALPHILCPLQVLTFARWGFTAYIMSFTSAYICSLRLYRIYYVLYKCLHLLAEALPHILCPLQVLTFARWGFTAYIMSFTSAYICSLRLYRIFYVLYKCLHLLAEALPHILCPLQVLTFARWGFTAYIMSFTSAYICSLRLYRIYYVLYKCLHLLAEALPHILCPLQVLTFARWGFTAYIMSFTSAYICSLRLYRIFYVLYKCLHLLAEALPHILCPLQVLTFARWGFTAYIMSFTSAYICSLRLYRIYYVLYKCLHLLAEALPHILCPLQVLTFARWGFTAYFMSFTSAYICSLRLYRIYYVLYKCLHLLAEALPHILCPLQVLTFARWGFTAYIMSFTSAYICSLRLYRIYYVLYKCLHLLAEALPHILCPLQVLTFARWGFTAYIMSFTSAYICSLRLYRIFYVLYKCLHLLAEALPHILCPLQVLTFARWGFTAYIMSFTSAYICSLRLYRIYYVLYKCLHLLAEALPHILCPLQVLTFARWGFTAYIMSFTSAYICSLRLYRIFYVLYKCLHLLAEALPHILCPLQVLTFARWGFTAYIMSFTSAYICSLRLYRIYYVLYKCLHLLAEALPHILCPL